jgi:hypothetical protein
MEYLGSPNNPVSSNNELKKVIKGRQNCVIYTRGTFKIDDDILEELTIRNIQLKIT